MFNCMSATALSLSLSPFKMLLLFISAPIFFLSLSLSLPSLYTFIFEKKLNDSLFLIPLLCLLSCMYLLLPSSLSSSSIFTGNCHAPWTCRFCCIQFAMCCLGWLMNAEHSTWPFSIAKSLREQQGVVYVGICKILSLVNILHVQRET